MHQNLPFHTGLYNSSQTADSTKQDQPILHALPFSLSLANNSSHLTHQVSSRSLWTNSEKEKYSVFACYFRQVLANLSAEGMNWNVFKGMAKFIQTRNPRQCRSHHLKLIKEFNGLKQFLSKSTKRIRRLEQKMHQAQTVLTQIQEEFQIYLEEAEVVSEPRNLLTETSIMKNTEAECLLAESREKMDKEEYKKTAVSYEENQNPVKDNHFSGSLSESKSFMHPKVKSNRSQLPSFDTEEKSQEKHLNSDSLVGLVKSRAKLGLMSSSKSKMSFEESELNFDTFNVPEQIRTTSEMYKLWQNSYQISRNDLEKAISHSEKNESN